MLVASGTEENITFNEVTVSSTPLFDSLQILKLTYFT